MREWKNWLIAILLLFFVVSSVLMFKWKVLDPIESLSNAHNSLIRQLAGQAQRRVIRAAPAPVAPAEAKTEKEEGE